MTTTKHIFKRGPRRGGAARGVQQPRWMRGGMGLRPFLSLLLLVPVLAATTGCPMKENEAIFSARGKGVADNPISARAVFSVEGDELVVFFQNTSAADVTRPAELLVGLFFHLPGNIELTPLSAVLCDQSTVLFPPAMDVDGTPLNGGTYPGGDVGAEWGYNGDLKNAPFHANHGIASWGMGGLFGNSTRFDRERNLEGPRSPDGFGYGITSVGDNAETGNPPVTGDASEGAPLIQSAVVFRFGGLPENFSLHMIRKVSFQYLGIANLKGIPDPLELIEISPDEALPGDPRDPGGTGGPGGDHEGCGDDHDHE